MSMKPLRQGRIFSATYVPDAGSESAVTVLKDCIGLCDSSYDPGSNPHYGLTARFNLSDGWVSGDLANKGTFSHLRGRQPCLATPSVREEQFKREMSERRKASIARGGGGSGMDRQPSFGQQTSSTGQQGGQASLYPK